MIDYAGEQYLTASEVAQRFNISWRTCYNNVLQQMQKCYLPGRRHALYRLFEVEQFAQVRVVTADACKASPASPTTDDAGDAVTSSPNLLQSEANWQSQYSLPGCQTQPVHA